jgi:hypothetical protein
MKYDDGFVAHLNGEQVTSSNAPARPGWSSGATGSNSDLRAVVFEDFDIFDGAELLRAGRNVLAIHGLNSSSTSDDFLMLPELLAATPAGEGGDRGISLDRTTRVLARARSGGEWSALNEAVFAVDSSSLRITEIMYHPPPWDPGSFSKEDFEFLELQNIGPRALNLTGMQVLGGIRFTFPDGDASPDEDLAPGEIVLIVKSLSAFSSQYAAQDLYIAGEYEGNLSNGGEKLLVKDRLGEVLVSFAYSDAWYPVTDGSGASLEIIDQTATPETWGDPTSWSPSSALGGSPGEAPPLAVAGRQLVGDINQDSRLDVSDPVRLLSHLFVASVQLPCEGDITDEANRTLVDFDDDGAVNLTDAIAMLNFLFRSGPGPALGTGCVPIMGCPDACTR